MNILIALFALISSIIAIYISSKNAKRTIDYTILDKILSEYRTLEMHRSLKYIIKYYKENGDGIGELLKIKMSNDTKSNELNYYTGFLNIELDSHRRFITHFFRKIAEYEKKGFLSEYDIREIYDPIDLDFLNNIIIPIEKYILRNKHDNKIQTNKTIDLLQYFYDKYGRLEVRIPVKCAGVPGEMLPLFKTLKFPKHFKAGGMFHPESLA